MINCSTPEALLSDPVCDAGTSCKCRQQAEHFFATKELHENVGLSLVACQFFHAAVPSEIHDDANRGAHEQDPNRRSDFGDNLAGGGIERGMFTCDGDEPLVGVAQECT